MALEIPVLRTKKQQAEFKVANSIAMAASHKAGEARNTRSLKAASTVFTGSKWDKRKRTELADTQTKMGIGVLVDAFSNFNDPEAVAILEEKDRVEANMAREMAEHIDRARREEIRSGMDVEQVPSRLRTQLSIHAAVLARGLTALRTKQGDDHGLVPTAAVTSILATQLPAVLPKDLSRLVEVFTWPGTEIVDVGTLARKLLTPPKLFALRVGPGPGSSANAPTPSRAQSAGGVRVASVRGSRPQSSPPNRPQSSQPRRSGNVLGLLGNDAGRLLCGKGGEEWNAVDIVAKLSTSLRERHSNVRNLFDALDADRDGKVSQEEFGRALALLGLRTEPGDVPQGTASSPHVSRLFRDFQAREEHSTAHAHHAAAAAAAAAAADPDDDDDDDDDDDAPPVTVPKEEAAAPLDLNTMLAALRRLRQPPPQDLVAAEQARILNQLDELGGLGPAPGGTARPGMRERPASVGAGGRRGGSVSSGCRGSGDDFSSVRGSERHLSGSVPPSVTWGDSVPDSPRGEASASDQEVCSPLYPKHVPGFRPSAPACLCSRPPAHVNRRALVRPGARARDAAQQQDA
jgi:hypothetical protein